MDRARYIYAAKAGDLLKVGMTADPAKRIRALRKGASSTLSPLAHDLPDEARRSLTLRAVVSVSWDAAPSVERLYHNALAHSRVVGEWFRCGVDAFLAIEADARELERQIVTRNAETAKRLAPPPRKIDARGRPLPEWVVAFLSAPSPTGKVIDYWASIDAKAK
jgi:hypothetical protein